MVLQCFTSFYMVLQPGFSRAAAMKCLRCSSASAWWYAAHFLWVSEGKLWVYQFVKNWGRESSKNWSYCNYGNLDPPVSQILFQANICRNPSLDSGGRKKIGFLHSIWHGYGMGIILSALWSWYQNKMDGQHQQFLGSLGFTFWYPKFMAQNSSRKFTYCKPW